MANLQKYMVNFHDVIKLKRFGENKTLRDKRDIIVPKVKNKLKEHFAEKHNETIEIEHLNQGSYDLDLGIVPENGNFDIDVGIILDCYKEEYDNPVEFKCVIEDLFKDVYSVPPEIKGPCLTITYTKDGEESFHVDLPIYAKSSEDSKLYLGRGRNKSDKSKNYWEESDPVGLSEHIKDRFSGDEKKQFKRVIRYIKKWKSIMFSNNGDNEPPSVGITLLGVADFNENTEWDNIIGKENQNDLKALYNLLCSICNRFISKYDHSKGRYTYSINYDLPVGPKGVDVFSKMTINQTTNFYYKLIDFKNAIKDAIDEVDVYEACNSLQIYFGDDFKVPEKKDTRYGVNKSSAPSAGSAIDG